MAALFGPKCMKILVMGGTRFVGRPLVARLQAQGHALTPVSYTHLTLPTR